MFGSLGRVAVPGVGNAGTGVAVGAGAGAGKDVVFAGAPDAGGRYNGPLNPHAVRPASAAMATMRKAMRLVAMWVT